MRLALTHDYCATYLYTAVAVVTEILELPRTKNATYPYIVFEFAADTAPNVHDSTASRHLSEVKHVPAQLVLRCGGRRCGVVSSAPAYVQKEGRYVLGSGRGGRGRNWIRVNLHASAGGGSCSRRGAGGGTHSHIRGGGSGQGCSGGCGRNRSVVGCGRGHHREMGS